MNHDESDLKQNKKSEKMNLIIKTQHKVNINKHICSKKQTYQMKNNIKQKISRADYIITEIDTCQSIKKN